MSTDSVAAVSLSRYNFIIQRLLDVGVPVEYLNQGKGGLVAFVKNNKSCLTIQQLVNAILPNDDDVDVDHDEYCEIMIWLQWLMFEDKPQKSVQPRNVCGYITKINDVMYRCFTCDLSPLSTTGICVSCFQNGNHDGHDFFKDTVDIPGGCCDCGDVTALSRSGFCSNHKGISITDCMKPSSDYSFGPVLDILLSFWKNKLLLLYYKDDVGHELTSTLVAMLLDFCECSESLLCFISLRICSSPALLETLLRAESFMNENVVVKLHELLVKLLVEPTFRYEFAKVLVVYYTTVVNVVISNGGDSAFKKRRVMEIFPVQIFSVPILTTRLVEEMDLLGVLFQCLGNIISSCAGEDGRMQVAKWNFFYETTFLVVQDIRLVMSHSAITKYLFHSRRELVATWIRFLVSAQGMDSQKREIGSHVEDGNENLHWPFILCDFMTDIFSFLVAGAFCMSSNEYTTDESSSSSYKLERDTLPIPSSALWLINEFLQSMQYWLKIDNTVGALSLDEFHGGLVGLRYLQSHCSRDDNILAERIDMSGLSYDVSSQDISVHIPLHRALSMVFLRSIRKYFDESESSYLPSISADRTFCNYDGDFFGQIFEGCHPYGFSASVMEHPLRIRSFCAQVNAGMWKMNGDSPMLFCKGYRSVSCSGRAQELDTFLLQCCAGLAPPDLYVQRILERFGLSNYLCLNVEEQHTVHEHVLVTEMLTLLIQIVKERRLCGLTSAESLQRELIFQLSVGATTRSNLVKCLPADLLKTNQLQQVLDTVAERFHPSGMTQESAYKLRASYWKELDLYHPCWNSRDLKAALTGYMRFSKVSALATQLPRWTQIYYPLKGIAKIATCKTLLQIIRSVLFYAANTVPRVPDGVLLTALHLLSLALDVCRVHKESGDLAACFVGDVIPLLAFTHEEVCVGMYGNQSLWSLLILLMSMRGERNLEENLAEAGNFSTLILNIIKSYVEIEPGLATQLQKNNPGLADKCLPGRQLFSDVEKRKAGSQNGQCAVLVEKRKYVKLLNPNEDEEMKDIPNLSKKHLDGKNSGCSRVRISFRAHNAN